MTRMIFKMAEESQQRNCSRILKSLLRHLEHERENDWLSAGKNIEVVGAKCMGRKI